MPQTPTEWVVWAVFVWLTTLTISNIGLSYKLRQLEKQILENRDTQIRVFKQEIKEEIIALEIRLVGLLHKCNPERFTEFWQGIQARWEKIWK